MILVSLESLAGLSRRLEEVWGRFFFQNFYEFYFAPGACGTM